MRYAARIDANQTEKKSRQKLGYNLICIVCNDKFRGFSKSKYCLNHKKEAAINKTARIKLGRPIDKTKKESKICLQCKKEFDHYKSRQRLYCSYKCHLDSGGAWRAGLASKESVVKYGAKKDANHYEVVDAMQKAGAYVIDMSHVGRGFPDLIVGFRSKTILMEIKNPKTSYGKRGLNKNQIKWKEQWTGDTYCVVDSIEAALRMIGVINEQP